MPEIAAIPTVPTNIATAKSVGDQVDPTSVATDATGFAAIIANFAGLTPPPLVASTAVDTANLGQGLPSTDGNLPAQTLMSTLPAGRNIALNGPSNPLQGVPLANNSALVAGLPVATVTPEAETNSGASTDTPGESNAFKFDVSALFQHKDTAPDNALVDQATPAPTQTQATSPSTPDLNAALMSNVTAQHTNAAQTRPPTLDIDAKLQVHSPHFGEGFAQQVTVLVEHGIQHARLTLNPAELGPVDVQISIQHDEATVQLASHHGMVRDAISDAMPRLRELLEQAGMRLADSGVFTQLPQREQAQQGSSSRHEFNDKNPSGQAVPIANAGPTGRTLRLGLVDAYV